MGRSRLSFLACLLCLDLTLVAQGRTILFLVAQPEESRTRNDSYVLPLSRPQDILHARNLIARVPGIEQPMVVQRIVASKDGVNRNLLAADKAEWSWHVEQFVSFTDVMLPEWPSSPTGLEANLDGWLNHNPGVRNGVLGFFGYTIVSELGPAFSLAAQTNGASLMFWWPDISTNAAYTTQGTNLVYTVESNDSLSTTNWLPVAGFTWPTSTNQVTIPAPSTPAAYYQVKAESASSP